MIDPENNYLPVTQCSGTHGLCIDGTIETRGIRIPVDEVSANVEEIRCMYEFLEVLKAELKELRAQRTLTESASEGVGSRILEDKDQQ